MLTYTLQMKRANTHDEMTVVHGHGVHASSRMRQYREVCLCQNYRTYYPHPCSLCRTTDLRLARFHLDFFKPKYNVQSSSWNYSFEIIHPIHWVPKLEHFAYILGHLDKNKENLGVMDFTTQKEFVLCTSALGYPVHEFYDVFFRYLAILHGEINFFSWS